MLQNSRKGAGAARNLGVASSESDRIAFIDQDDVWHPRHLELMNIVLDRHGSSPAAFGRAVRFEDGREPSFPEPAGGSELVDLWEAFPFGVIEAPSVVVVRRGAYERAGFWSEEFAKAGVGDYHMWLRLASQGALVRLQTATIGRRAHATQWSARLTRSHSASYCRSMLNAAEDAFRQRNGTPVERARQSRRLEAAERICGFLESCARGDEAGMVSHARGLEIACAGSSEVRHRAVGQLSWFQHGVLAYGSSAERSKVLKGLLVTWPRDAPLTRDEVREAVTSTAWFTSLLGFAALRPFSGQRMRAVWEKLGKRLIDRNRKASHS